MPVVQRVRSPHHEVRAAEGSARAKPALRARSPWSSAVGEPAVPVHVVHLLLEAAALGPVHALLLLHEAELLLPALPELFAGLAALRALLLDLALAEAGLDVHHEVRVHLLLVLQSVAAPLIRFNFKYIGSSIGSNSSWMYIFGAQIQI